MPVSCYDVNTLADKLGEKEDPLMLYYMNECTESTSNFDETIFLTARSKKIYRQ